MKSNAFRAIFKNNEGFSSKIIFILIDRENCLIWGWKNPRAIVEKRVAAWRGFWAGSVIGSFFFENTAGQAITVNDVRYRDVKIHFFRSKSQDVDVEDAWFQQDGATQPEKRLNRCTSRVISRFGDQKSLAGQIVRFNAVDVFFEVQDSCLEAGNRATFITTKRW